MLCVEPSCYLFLLSHLKIVCRLLEICNTGPGDCTAASLEPGINMFLTLLWISLGILWIICTCLCVSASFTVFWHCISGHCISAGTSTFMYCCCDTSVLCCTFWLYCTAPVATPTVFASCVDHVDILHLVNLVSLPTESGES